MSLQQALNAISILSGDEQQIVYETLANKLNPVPSPSLKCSDARIANGLKCAYCNVRAIKHGKTNKGIQRYRCTNCKRTFVATSQTPFQRTRKSDRTWYDFLLCTVRNDTLKNSASSCGIAMSTAFIWRHKIYAAIEELLSRERFSGIIEADETFYLDSFKGRHRKGFNLPRQPRKNGGKSKFRGLSREQLCIPCLADQNGHYFAVLCKRGRISVAGLEVALANRIEDGAILCSDSANAYRKFAKAHYCELHQIPSGHHAIGGFNIEKINSMHRTFKDTTNHENRGVATNYLNQYLTFLCWKSSCSANSMPETINRLIETLALARRNPTSGEVPNIQPVPLLT